ncbi:UNVERIFIED_CONTAM: hypothetical protein Sradi_7175600, partial [Sesamum radiatum]
FSGNSFICKKFDVGAWDNLVQDDRDTWNNPAHHLIGQLRQAMKPKKLDEGPGPPMTQTIVKAQRDVCPERPMHVAAYAPTWHLVDLDVSSHFGGHQLKEGLPGEKESS